MSDAIVIGVVSDVHYAGDAEQARGDDYELRAVRNPVLRRLLTLYRHFIWLRHPLKHNHLLDSCMDALGDADWIVANGDYSCDSGFIGVSDPAARASANECLGRLCGRFGNRLRANLGDHELGKLSLVGQNGGMRLESYRRAVEELELAPFWKLDCGSYLLLGVTSSLIALPLFAADTLPEERSTWEELRAVQMDNIRQAFAGVTRNQRLILFCHDPSALPFLWREDCVGQRLRQVELTIVGHLHSRLILRNSRWLSGMPAIGFLGNSVKRMSTALHEARHWKPFHVELCPSLAGIELLKDGGFLTINLDRQARVPPRVQLHRLPR